MDRRVILLWTALYMSMGTAFATDYDYQAAERAWQSRKQVLDAAEADLQRRQNELAPLQRAFEEATRRVQTLENDLQANRNEQRRVESEMAGNRTQVQNLGREREDLRNRNVQLERELRDAEAEHLDIQRTIDRDEAELRQVERRIRELESGPNDGAWTCNYVDRGFEEHRGGHPATNADQATAKAEAEAACLAVHGECRLSSCTQPDSSELTRLKVRRNELNAALSRSRQELADCQRTEEALRGQIRHNNDGIARIGQTITDLDRNYASMQSRLNDLRRDEDSKELSLGRARNDLANARSARDRAQTAVDRAEATRDVAYREERAAYNYYQEVLGNYNRAYNAAVAKGRQDGESDTRREARARAEAPAAAAGQAAGVVDGERAGTIAAKEIAGVRGYNHGLQSGATDAGLAQAYREGLTTGRELAGRKARAENFPEGYNLKMNEVLSSAPASVEEFDLSEALPDVPGDTGGLLTPEPKPIGSVAGPAYTPRAEPPYTVPDARSPQFTVPTPDQRYFAPQCDTQPLQQFVDVCRESYQSTYAGSFSGQYRSAYASFYAASFDNAAATSYRSARGQSFPDLYAEFSLEGALHKGTLDGFAAQLPTARMEQDAAGRDAFETYRGQGFLTLLREVSLIEAVADGNFSPGEAVTLTVQIDNFGKLLPAPEKLHIKIGEQEGSQFEVTTRALPSLPGDTRTTLTGVLTGATAAELEQALRLKVILEYEASEGNYTLLDEALFEDGIRLPLAITNVAFDAPLTIGTPATATLTLENRTNLDVSDLALDFSLLGFGLTSDVTEVTVGQVAAEGSSTIDIDVTADAYAGGNVPVTFVLQTEGLAGSGPLTMKKDVAIPVQRAGRLDLCYPRCGDTLTLPLRVRAGQVLRLPAQFTFTGNRQDTFEFGKLDASDARLTGANGSTVRVGPSAWGPGSRPYQANFAYNVPTALRGQSHWVTFYLKQGRTTIHILKIPFIVE